MTHFEKQRLAFSEDTSVNLHDPTAYSKYLSFGIMKMEKSNSCQSLSSSLFSKFMDLTFMTQNQRIPSCGEREL
jgi:hypothetical protein